MLRTDVAELLLKKYGKNNAPSLKAGDTVKIHQKIKEGEKERVQIFEGLVIAVKHGRSLDGTFTVRKIAAGGVGVERTYPLHSPMILKVERTKTADVNRAKLYYMRDRMGKNARFKNEDKATATSWIENEVVVPEEVEEVRMDAPDTTQEVEAAVIEAAAEQEAAETAAEAVEEQVAEEVALAAEQEEVEIAKS
jgi:large subunit ribosomal protein L19